MAAVALGQRPTLDAMRAGLAGNLCRCTGYSAIYRSIEACDERHVPRDAGLTNGRTPETSATSLEISCLVMTRLISDAALRDLAPHAARAASLADALRMLRDEGPLVPMAGCTDLYVSLNFGTLKDTRFLNLWRLDGAADDRGARRRAVDRRARDLHRSHPVAARPHARLPMLAAAAREVGGVQIQNRGTIGGNVANASPAGDTLPVLAAADAVVVLQSAGGTRRVPFTAFYTGYRQTVPPPGRADRRVRDPADSRAAVVPQGRHARGAGDLEGRDGAASAGDRPRIALGSVGADRRPAAADRSGAGRGRVDRRGAADARSTRSRRSTTSARPPSIAAASRPTCSRRFWNGTSAHSRMTAATSPFPMIVPQ